MWWKPCMSARRACMNCPMPSSPCQAASARSMKCSRCSPGRNWACTPTLAPSLAPAVSTRRWNRASTTWWKKVSFASSSASRYGSAKIPKRCSPGWKTTKRFIRPSGFLAKRAITPEGLLAMKRFRAFRINNDANGYRAGLTEVSVADLTDGEVLVKVEWSSVNFKDALAGTGKGKILRQFPLNGGIDVAGHVVASTDPAFQEGDAVLCTGCV